MISRILCVCVFTVEYTNVDFRYQPKKSNVIWYDLIVLNEWIGRIFGFFLEGKNFLNEEEKKNRRFIKLNLIENWVRISVYDSIFWFDLICFFWLERKKLFLLLKKMIIFWIFWAKTFEFNSINNHLNDDDDKSLFGLIESKSFYFVPLKDRLIQYWLLVIG